MQLSDFDYSLPEKLIAQYPAEKRTDSKLLVLNRCDGSIEHKKFPDIINYLCKGDILVLNNTKVFPARLYGRKLSGGKVEVLLIRKFNKEGWECMMRGSIRNGEEVIFNNKLKAVVEEDFGRGRKSIKFNAMKGLDKILERHGNVPLPPYIKRVADISDRKRYQTVYAKKKGAVAAPTAGLHFSNCLIGRIKKKGLKIAEVTLHVGPGTFQPVKGSDITKHKMEPEYFKITEGAARAVNNARMKNGRVIAVGTTSAKALEAASDDSGVLHALEGYSKLFIYPPYKFRTTDSILTNFHLPKSTLLMLVSAFADRRLIRKAYKEAVERNYRFYSYGDAMLII